MKTIDDALELRGRILGAFEQAERSSDPVRRAKLLTFVVVGAGPTGVEMAGQIAELADTRCGRVPPHRLHPGPGDPARRRTRGAAADGREARKEGADRLEKLGVEIQLNAMVTDVDRNGITVKHTDGAINRIEAASKVWSAGVSASPLGKIIADQSDAEIDRAGRVKVRPIYRFQGIRTCS